MQLYLVSGDGSDGVKWVYELCFQDSDGDYEGMGAHTRGEYILAEKNPKVIEACTASELQVAMLAIYEPKGK